MERNTILAIVLSVLVIVGFSFLNSILFPPRNRSQDSIRPTETTTEPAASPVRDPGERREIAQVQALAIAEDDVPAQSVVLRNEVVEAVFTNRGARLESFKLLEHLDQGQPVEMVNRDFGGEGSLELAWGGLDAPRIQETFRIDRADGTSVVFSKTYRDLDGKPFQLIKTFKLEPNEYILQVEILVRGFENVVPRIPGEEKGLTLVIGPQIGPRFEVLDNQKEFRRYFAFANDSLEEIKLNGSTEQRATPLVWAGIAGKYFALIGIPGTPGLTTWWSNKPTEELKSPSILGFSTGRPASPTSSWVVRVFMGPKQQRVLERFGSLQLTRIIDRNLWLGWLEDIMKLGLNLLYMVIPNYGVGIILLTILLRLVLMPLTISSQRSMAAMAALQPKVQALQEKFKNDPGKLNEEIARLYQKERINPLGGCLPLLLQLPLFFAFYGLLSSHFELRGAVFIPGWIEDLSLPDSILSFGGFRVPLLNWTDLRLLPIVMLLSQFLMSWVTPSQGTTGAQAKIFSIGLPIFFFFLLYEFPSGLVLYWTVTNIISAASQYYFNTHLKKSPA